MHQATTRPVPTPLPIVAAGCELGRDEVLDGCARYIVEAALNQGGDPFNPDPAWLGARSNSVEGFWISVDGDEEGPGAPVRSPGQRVYLNETDLADAVARARGEVEAELGYVPSGLHRSVDLDFGGHTFGVVAMPAEDGRWAASVGISEPPPDEYAAEAERYECEFFYHFGRDECPVAGGRWDTPGEAISAAVLWIASTYNSAVEDGLQATAH